MENNIAKFLNLKATNESPIELFDSNGNQIYHEDSNGFWCKKEFDSNGNQTYYEDNSFWVKREYDNNGNQIYYENREGKIIDNRPKKEMENRNG